MAKQVDSTNIGTLLEALITKVKSFFWRKEETDNTPTSGSDNLVKSGGVYSSLQGIRQLKVLNLGDFWPSTTGTQTLGTKSEAAAALNITEAQLDSLISGEYDCVEFGGNGGFRIVSMGHIIAAYMCMGLNSQDVAMPFILGFLQHFDEDVYAYEYSPLGINDVTVGGESVVNVVGGSCLAAIPAIPPADYVAMIDLTSSTDESGNVKQSAAIVSGTFAEIDTALLAQKTVLLIGRCPDSDPVSYRYFRSGEHMPGFSVFFASIGADMIPGSVNVAVWYHGDSDGPERVEMYDGTGIMDALPMGDGNAVTSIEKHPLFPALIANKDKTFVDTAEQSLTDAQKSQARTNIGAGTYSKPANGIPASDLAHGVIPTIPTEVFIVTYGMTTQAEIKAAVAAGQLPVCKYGDNLYVYAGESSADYSQFTSVLYDTAYRIYVKNSTWGSGSYEVYSKPSGGIPASDIADGVIPAAPVNADWNATSGLAKILNKPTIPAAQVPSDWNATEGVSRILNKPTVPTQYAGSPTAGGFANKAVAIPFGQVDAGSTATEITATVDNFPETLTDGVCAFVRNNAIASASGFTLNINGTGAKPVYQTLADASRVSTVFNANSTYLFVYNSTRVEGGCWDLYYGYNSNDNTIGYNLRTNGASAPPAAQKYYRYRLLFTSANNQSLVPANTSSSTSATAAKTVNQTKIDPFGVIFYYSYTSAVNAAASPNASYLWMQYNGIALGYSFNRTGEALEMTARDPVYLKCAPQSDGSAIIDANNPIVQALPTTADGKIYIFLGFAESATALTLYYWHPVYYHDGTSVRLWAGRGIDTTPTQDSTNLVTSGGVYTAIQNAGGGGGSETDEYLSKYFTIEALSSGTIEWRTIASMGLLAATVSYRINGGTWVENVYPYKSTAYTDAVIFVSQGDRVEFKGTSTSIGSHVPSNRSYFAGTARFKVYGNIMSLIGGDNFVGLKELPHTAATEVRTFAGLFQDNTGVVDASNLRLPATTLSDSCYYQMFKGCTSLISAPTLPATTLTSQCYYGMFDGCIALTNAPALLATTLASNCYSYMFRGCTALTDAPSLRAVTLASSCYHYMFYGCTNLNHVIALFTDTPGSNYTKDWLDGVSATGTFVKNSSATWDVSGSSGIPSGWTVETTSR